MPCTPSRRLTRSESMRIQPDNVRDIPCGTRLRIRIKRPNGSEESIFGKVVGYDRDIGVSWELRIRWDGDEERFRSTDWEGLYLPEQQTLALRSRTDETVYPREGTFYHLVSDIECLHDRTAILSYENHYICVDSYHDRPTPFGWFVFTPRDGSGIPIKVDSAYVDLKVVRRADNRTSYLYVMKKELEA